MVAERNIRLAVVHNARAKSNRLKLEDVADDTQSSDAKWVQVASEGEFLGYGGGDHPGFTLDRGIFEQVITNIHRHPSFKAGPNGFGTEGVIPWDYSHASEQDPTSGSLPMIGAPAQGWSMDAVIRNSPDNKAELWMLTEFGEPAKTYVQNGQYRWASVALSFESFDANSGNPMGALITSIALTNTPFIEGMAQLAAERQTQSGVVQAAALAAKADEERKMDELLKMLATLLGCGRSTQESITGAINELLELRQGLVKLHSIAAGRDSTQRLIEVATESHEGSIVLNSLVKALAVKDGAGAISRVTELLTASTDLEELKPKLLEMQAAQEASEEIEAKADVDRALAAKGFGEDMRPMLSLSRKTDKEAFNKLFPVTQAPPTTQAAVLTTSIAAAPGGQQLAVAPANQVTVDTFGNITAHKQTGINAPPPAATGVLGGTAVNLASYVGRNDVERMVACLKATRPGFPDMKWDDQFEAACLALKELKQQAAA